MTLREYIAQVNEWRRRYGIQDIPPPKYNPATVRLSCKKCGKMRARMNRHHKSNDYFFALQRPDLYAKRYIEYNREDCDVLCNKCHKNFHKYAKKLVVEMYKELDGLGLPSHEWCEMWKGRFLSKYNYWIKLPVRKRTRRRR